MRALALALLLLAPVAAAQASEGPAVVLLVREAWPYGEGTFARVDGLPVAPGALREAVLDRLAAPAHATLDLGDPTTGEVVVGVTAHGALPDVRVRLAALGAASARDVADAPVAPLAGERVEARFPRPDPVTDDLALWLEVVDDPTGRWRAGEVLQSVRAAATTGSVREDKAVLLEVRRCPSCADAEALARDVAAELRFGAPEHAGYWRAPSLREVGIFAVLAVAALAAFVPWRRTA